MPTVLTVVVAYYQESLLSLYASFLHLRNVCICLHFSMPVYTHSPMYLWINCSQSEIVTIDQNALIEQSIVVTLPLTLIKQ